MNVIETHIPGETPLVGPPKELLSSTVFLLKRLGFKAKDSSHEAFEGTGLNAFHFAVMALLEEDPRETQAVIADALGYDRSHIVRLLDELEEKDLVVRKRDPEDRRRHVVKLTPGRPQGAGEAPRNRREAGAGVPGAARHRRAGGATRPACSGWRAITTRAAG